MVDVAPPGVVFFVLGVADSRKKAVSAGIAHLLDDHVSRPAGYDLVCLGRVDRLPVARFSHCCALLSSVL